MLRDFFSWLQTLEDLEDTYALKDGSRRIEWRHRIKASCYLLDFCLFLVLLPIPIGHIIHSFSWRFRGEIYHGLYFLIVIAISATLSFILNKICNLFWLSLFTIAMMILWGIRMNYCLTHFVDFFDTDFIIF